MNRIASILFLVLASIGFGHTRGYYTPQLPRLSSASSTDLVEIWSGTNLYAITQSALSTSFATGKLDATNGSAVSLTAAGFTGTGSFNTSGGTSPLRVDDTNDRVHVNGSGGSMPFNVIGNVTRWGADDGAIGNRTVTAGTDKDFNFSVYTRDNNEFMLFRGIGSTSANTLYIGYGQSGYRQSTRIYFGGGASVSATSASIYGTFDGINGEWGFGSAAEQDGSVLTAQSTTKPSIPFPRQTTVQWTAYSQILGSGVYDTTVNRVGVSDGTTRRYLAETLTGSTTADISSISAASEGTTTIAITGAATGDQVLVSPVRFAPGVYTRAAVTSAGTVTVYVYNSTASPYDPASTTFRVNVIRQ